MPWVSLCSARRERRMTDESAVTDRGKLRPKARLAIRTKRTSKTIVSRGEKPKTGQLGSVLRFFTCLQFSPQSAAP